MALQLWRGPSNKNQSSTSCTSKILGKKKLLSWGFAEAGQIPVLLFSFSSAVSNCYSLFYATVQECASVRRWLASLLAREFLPVPLGMTLWEEQPGWCMPCICTNVAVVEGENVNCWRKPTFRPVAKDTHTTKFWQFALWEIIMCAPMPSSPFSCLYPGIACGCGSHLALREMSASQKRCPHSHFHTETFLSLLLVPVITSLLQCQQSSIRHRY